MESHLHLSVTLDRLCSSTVLLLQYSPLSFP